MSASETQAEFDALNIEYKAYINKLRADWMSVNRVRSNNVYEVMEPWERAQVDSKNHEWARYVTPFAEAWWKERGYEVFWPDDSSKPIKVRKFEAA